MKTLDSYLLTVENVFNALGLINKSTMLILKKGFVVNQENFPDSIHLSSRTHQHTIEKPSCSTRRKKNDGGLCFMVEDKMCCGLVFNKKKKQDLLMARIGLEK